MKKGFIIAAAAIIILILSYYAGSGFCQKNDVALSGYSLSADGSKLTFRTDVMSSVGFIRGFKNNGGGVRPHYLVFYSTFGGINSAWGAKNEFELDLSDSDTEIYFNRGKGGYELVLQKDKETGEWTRP